MYVTKLGKAITSKTLKMMIVGRGTAVVLDSDEESSKAESITRLEYRYYIYTKVSS